MKVSVAASLLLLAPSTMGFVGPSRSAFLSRTASLKMSDETPPAPPVEAPPKDVGGALVPIKEETVEFTAGIVGGLAGFAVGGPVLGIVMAGAANYVAKMDGDATDVVQAVSKSCIQVFNYLANLDTKYEILTKAKDSLQTSLDGLKKQDSVDPGAVEKVETALSNTNSKIQEINDEYDLVGGGMTALGVVGDLVEKAVVKAGELNEEYQLSDKAIGALKGAVDKAKDAAKSASG